MLRSFSQLMDNNNIISQLTGDKVSMMSQAYSQDNSIRDSLMCNELYFFLFFLTWTCIKTKTKPYVDKKVCIISTLYTRVIWPIF